MSHALSKVRQSLTSSALAWESITGRIAPLRAALSAAVQLAVEPSLETLSREPWPTLQAREPDIESNDKPRLVFLGCPGVGKGTYARKVSKLLDIPHISTGDLVRAEVKKDTPSSRKLEAAMRKGQLIPDEVIVELLATRLQAGSQVGEAGFILDGFPRKITQAEILSHVTPLDQVVNLRLREDVLINKCLGRRTCSQCGGNFNTADIFLPATPTEPEIVMPPLLPPRGCESKMVVRADDTEEVVRSRLESYRAETLPLEEYYRARGLLLDFEVLGGIPETWPRLLGALGVNEQAEDVLPKAA